MVRGFQYRVYPTPEQKIALAKTFGCVRYVFNWALNLRTTAWHERQERIGYAASDRALTELKRQPEVAWLNEVSSVPTQQTLRHLANRVRQLLGAWREIPGLQEAGRQTVGFFYPVGISSICFSGPESRKHWALRGGLDKSRALV